MQHTIPVDQLGPAGQVMAHAIEACVHCGFCLAACPTYAVLGEEMDSPRGRIVLMKSALEGALPVEATLPYVDRCLGCLACMPACPSGVTYGELLPLFRAHANSRRPRSLLERAAHTLVHETLPYPGRLRLAAAAGPAGRLVRGALPAAFQAMLDLLPEALPTAPALPEVYPAHGPRRARVGQQAGSVQQAQQPGKNRGPLRVVGRDGVEVVIPRGQGCCGSLGLHTGELERARRLARQNLRVFPADVDAVVTNAAGCGSGMKEYGVLFTGQPEAGPAKAFAGRVRDVSEFLDALGLVAAPALPAPLRLAYHDACHLAHAQGLQAAPRRLLAAIGGLTVVEVPEGEMCCGSAGTYNLEQPHLAETFGARKARNISSTGAQAVATGNIGCLVQIRAHLARQGQALPVYHTLELLDQAYSQNS